MADALDIAGDNEQRDRQRAIDNHRNRRLEKPDQDDNGNRFCLSCGDQIPPLRVESIDAVRCVDCQGILEQKHRATRF